MMKRFALLIPALGLAGCGEGPDATPLRVAMIGEPTEFQQPIAALPAPSDAVLLHATAQGLVRFDSEGQVEPALAQRWIVIDEGQTYLFRLNDLSRVEDMVVTAAQIAQQLRNASRAGSGNRLAALLTDIEAINAVTPQVIEINLARPRPDFLQLLAAPDLAIFIEGTGFGPFAFAADRGPPNETIMLIPRSNPPEEIDGEIVEPPQIPPGDMVGLHFQTAALAVARFETGLVDIVLGGDWASLPFAEAVNPNSNELQFDPVDGLYGLIVVEETAFLSTPQNRELLSLAVDRGQLAGYFGGDRSEARLAIIPADAEGLMDVVGPPWANSTMALRRGFARQAVAEWRAANGDIEPLRVALPDGPGSRVAFAVLRSNWAAVGIPSIRVDWTEDADLRLIDRVAPTDNVQWYLDQFRCSRGLPCSKEYSDLLDDVWTVPAERVRAIRAADAATELQRLTPYIPLLRPIRWSLRSRRIGQFTPNRFASHPLDRLAPPG